MLSLPLQLCFSLSLLTLAQAAPVAEQPQLEERASIKTLYSSWQGSGRHPYVRIVLQDTLSSKPLALDSADCGSKGLSKAKLQWHNSADAVKADKNAARLCETFVLYPQLQAQTRNTFAVGVSDLASPLAWTTAETDGQYTPVLTTSDPFFQAGQQFHFKCKHGKSTKGKLNYFGSTCQIVSKASNSCLTAVKWKGANKIAGALVAKGCNWRDRSQIWAIQDVSNEFTANNHLMNKPIKELPAPPA